MLKPYDLFTTYRGIDLGTILNSKGELFGRGDIAHLVLIDDQLCYF